MSFARKSRDALRSRSEAGNTSGSTANPDPNSSDQSHSGAYVSGSDDEYEHVLPHLSPPSSLGCSALLARSEVYSTPLAARGEVERARAELAAASGSAFELPVSALGSTSELHRTPPKNRTSWCPPVGSPSSWVTEREARTSLPEWDFRHSLTQLAHRRTSSNLTAFGVDEKTGDSFHTAPSHPPSHPHSTAGDDNRGHRTNPSASSTHTRIQRSSSAPEPGSAHSQRPDGSFVAIYEATPFDPLPPHNFSSLASLPALPRSVSDSAVGREDMPSLVGAAIDGSRTLAVVDHGDAVGVHSYSASASNMSIFDVTGWNSNSNSNSANMSNAATFGSDTLPGKRRRPVSLNMASVDRLPTIAGGLTPTSPYRSFGSGSDLLADTEWVPVDPPSAAESWRRVDGVCGVMAVVVLVLCFVSPVVLMIRVSSLLSSPCAPVLALFLSVDALPRAPFIVLPLLLQASLPAR